jgi:hypothetical protein
MSTEEGTMIVTAELDICQDCAVVIANGDDSADPERAAAAFDHAFGVWGDGLRELSLSCSDLEEECAQDMFRCDYCGEDVYGYRHAGVILGR